MAQRIIYNLKLQQYYEKAYDYDARTLHWC